MKRLRAVADRLDDLLSNFVGSADVGPYVAPDPTAQAIDIACPYCGLAMSLHNADRSATIGRLYCPPASTP